MNFLLIVNVIASFLTIVFAVFTSYYIFHRYSVQHRVNAMTAKMTPMIIGRKTKEQIVEELKLDDFNEQEVRELYDILLSEANLRKSRSK